MHYILQRLAAKKKKGASMIASSGTKRPGTGMNRKPSNSDGASGIEDRIKLHLDYIFLLNLPLSKYSWVMNSFL